MWLDNCSWSQQQLGTAADSDINSLEMRRCTNTVTLGCGDGPIAGMSGTSEAVRAKPSARTGGGSVLLTLTDKTRPNEIEGTGPGWAKAAREQTSAAQSITPFIFFLFLFVFGRIFQIYFFGGSGPVRELVLSYRSPRTCYNDAKINKSPINDWWCVVTVLWQVE